MTSFRRYTWNDVQIFRDRYISLTFRFNLSMVLQSFYAHSDHDMFLIWIYVITIIIDVTLIGKICASNNSL